MPRVSARTDGGRRPAVVFADDGEWSCFFQLAAELRKAGFVTLRVTTRPPSGRVWTTAFRAIFDHTIAAPARGEDWAPQELAALRGLTETHTVLDIQTTETMAELIYGFAARLPAPHRCDRWASRLVVTDKIAISNLLASAGVLVPPILLASDATPEQAADKLGLPLVLKERVGYGGAGVHVVETVVEAERLLDIGSGRDRFFETYVVGEGYSYGGLALDGSVVVGIGYAVLARANPMAPPAVVSKRDSSELDEIAAAVVAATGLVGLFNLNLIRDADGDYWLHDINPRSFGSMAACAQMGAPLGRAYVSWLRAQPTPAPSPRARDTAVVFPDALRGTGGSAYSASAVARWMRDQRKAAGAAYVALETIRNRPARLGRG